MNVFVRADASVEIGTGHVMRCITLAERLRELGANVSFISRSHEGNLNKWINDEKNFSIYELAIDSEWQSSCTERRALYERWLGTSIEKDAYETQQILIKQDADVDWIIVDHYALDERWERELRPYSRKIMVIDDLANRKHDCDVLLDQNLYDDMEVRYTGLVPIECETLFGPSFALLRKEFIEARKTLHKRQEQIKRMLVFFGGSDPTNETMKTIKAIRLLTRPDITVDVVVGKSNPNKEQIKNCCTQIGNVNFHCQVSNMAELMGKADLAIGAGGSATWERCCLGLYSILVAIADNQIVVCEYLQKNNICTYIGESSNLTVLKIRDALDQILCNSVHLASKQKALMQLVDGKGVDRVSTQLIR
ncbi:UDP-2,4-diacetamido-2,4,6-trideoxy-beta-L-altropyranose hydrolase [Aneurinibacillus sp. Ricciae_BoGa-3]|uniref:UDP-2,4-diacetamido-2,4, 6-trideoxy-beta-L-altropyranose hydrolase n=1 Tax=Aneurinibacillus sp. Ricciae_BoGa-3 TaxID=3022697 RepID=UPI00233FA41B|nr:UDP-2,4-diacetamido-2,4,6-trideoxy-beta-L-altropyranose hydrolase [Aneurinibacillus sp. Ricciae_BoGa-3]WCK54190.1 UDP-2,4-diacetamido-2,4,6-trideoxy-beta-L-altropyranose hydrolase [Aneurinibacillus sp. Ricciae_BoGa-3]